MAIPKPQPRFSTLSIAIDGCDFDERANTGSGRGNVSGSGVATLCLNRPSRANALNSRMFAELPMAVELLDRDPRVRAIVLAGQGSNFCGGIDLGEVLSISGPDPAGDEEEHCGTHVGGVSGGSISSSSSSTSRGQAARLGSSDGTPASVHADKGITASSGAGHLHGQSKEERQEPKPCEARRRLALQRNIGAMQRSLSSFERLTLKPVIAAVHGACIGGGVDVVTACDMRYATKSARFSVKEVDLAITADLGSLQRLPRLVGEAAARELALTAREFSGEEAFRLGLVQAVFETRDDLMRHALAVARSMAAKSPLAVQGTKAVLNFSRDHSVDEGLEHVALWNSAFLLSRDLEEVIEARLFKRLPQFSRL